MELKTISIQKRRDLYQQVKQLYMQSFPKEERIPWRLLYLYSRWKLIDLTLWLDEGVFCGFTASVNVEGLHFVLFFAVDPLLQGKGYGSAILSDIKREYETVALNVEPLIDTAPNYAQRLRRFDFYRKNGFVDTGYDVWEVGGKFRVLSTDEELNISQYRKVFLKLTGGLWKVRMKKDA